MRRIGRWYEANHPFEIADMETTGDYRITRRAAGSWSTTSLVATGAEFSPGGGSPYPGGAQFDADGNVVLSREDAGEWIIEHRVIGGATTELARDTKMLVRPGAVDDPSDEWTAAYLRLDAYASFTSWTGHTHFA